MSKTIEQILAPKPEARPRIYAENELPEPATAKEYLAVQSEGKRQVQRSILKTGNQP